MRKIGIVLKNIVSKNKAINFIKIKMKKSNYKLFLLAITSMIYETKVQNIYRKI